jgi:hypothetical protein
MLLSKDNSDIIKYLKDLENEGKNLKMEILKLCWFMRGGITYQEALNLSPDERAIVGDLVKENLETTKKTGQPFF